MSNLTTYSRENGGRVLALFLLFLLALYEFYSMGITGMALVCTIPLLIVGVYVAFQYKMAIFWFIFAANYFIMGIIRYYSVHAPITVITIIPQILLLMVAVIDIRKNTNAKFGNLMNYGLFLWLIYVFLQLFNESLSLPISVGDWARNFLFLGFIFFITCSLITLYVRSPQNIMKFCRLWAYFSISGFFWAWRQQTFGWDNAEWGWLMAVGARTHLIGGSVRYFSFFTDAATFGCCMGASAVSFYVFAITTKLRKDKILFLIAAIASTWGFFLSGTRTALMCFLVGVALYVILSRSFKIAVPVAILGSIFFFILAFTNIGQGNMQIRRMRSAFNKDDASANVRDINKATLAKYLKDAPFGMGLNIDESAVPANHKYKIVLTTSNDSTYVFLWQRVGIVGAILFAIVNGLILFGGCIIVFTKLKSKVCIGIASGFCCSFLAIHAGGYANHILLQYPNLFLFYGGMAIVYLLPDIEKDFEVYCNQLFAKQEEHKRLKLEKKKLSRV